MNTTKRIEKTVEALEKKQLKNALFLTDREETKRHHQWVEEAARSCLSNKETCDTAIKEAKAKIQETVSVALEDTSLEGVEEMLEENVQEPAQDKTEQSVGQTDEELYRDCEECNIATAAVEFVKIAEKDECDGDTVLAKLQPLVNNKMTMPETWLKTMAEVTEKATCNKMKYGQVLGELTQYLEERDSPILKNLDKE